MNKTMVKVYSIISLIVFIWYIVVALIGTARGIYAIWICPFLWCVTSIIFLFAGRYMLTNINRFGGLFDNLLKLIVGKNSVEHAWNSFVKFVVYAALTVILFQGIIGSIILYFFVSGLK